METKRALDWWHSLSTTQQDAYCLDFVLGKTPSNMKESDIVELYWRK